MKKIIKILIVVLTWNWSSCLAQNDSVAIRAKDREFWKMVYEDPEKAKKIVKEQALLVKNSQWKKAKCFYFNEVATGFYFTGNKDSADFYFKRTLSEAERIKDKKFEGLSLNNIGAVQYELGNTKEAIVLYEKAYLVRKEAKDNRGASQSLYNIGFCYQNLGNFPLSLEYSLKSAAVLEKTKDAEIDLANCYLNIGNTYLLLKDYDKAIHVYKKSAPLFEKMNDKFGSGTINCCISGAYLEMKKYDSVFVYGNKSNAYAFKMKDTSNLIDNFQNIGQAYLGTDQNLKALEYFNEALRYAQSYKDDKGISEAYLNLGNAMMKAKNSAKAKLYLEQSVVFAEKGKAKDVLFPVYEKLASIFEGEGNFKLAYSSFKNFIGIRDSLYNETNNRNIARQEANFEYGKRSFADSLKTAQEASIKQIEYDQQIKQQRLYTMMVAIGVLVMIFIAIILFRANKQKQKDNILISEQKKQVEQQKKEIETQKHIVEEKQKETIDSINYALQIQKTLLANHKLVNQTVPDSFVLFKPKDIVSGDFYWATHKDDRFYLAVCDSTGHGVPGAFMSLLNISFLNEAISEKNIVQPNEVFEHVRKRLIENISQEGRQDGMDGIIICIQKNKITYASAQNAPILVSQNNLIELDADKMPVGKGERKEMFKNYTIDFKKGDVLYLYTDGFADQFGGPKGKKFKYKALNELLLQNSGKPVEEQKEILATTFENWKGNLEQVDDLCVLGIRL